MSGQTGIEKMIDSMERAMYQTSDGRRLELRRAKESDRQQIWLLWKLAFQDSDAYMMYYFSNVARRNDIFVAARRDTVVSMIHLNPYRLVCSKARSSGETGDKIYDLQSAEKSVVTCGYIVGVATLPSYRRQGVMSALMEYVLYHAKKTGMPFVYLMPENAKYYRHLGFERLEMSRYIESSDLYDAGYEQMKGAEQWTLLKTEELSDAEWMIFNRRLAGSYDLFAYRSKEYMEDLQLACRALCGDVTVICDASGIFAVYGVMREDEKTEIVQYISAEPSLRALAFGIRRQNLCPIRMSEIFGDWTNCLKTTKESCHGHGIMFRVLDEKWNSFFNGNLNLLINELV